MKKLKVILTILNILIFIIFCVSGFYYYKDYMLNRKLKEYKKEYISLNKDIEKYTNLKNEIDLIYNDNNTLTEKIESLKKDIDNKNNSINSYNNKISDLNNKISILTGAK